MKVESKKEVPFIAASLLGAALLLVLGIGFMAPAGEQAKLAYNGDLWCVSNFIEERPYRRLPDGRAAKDPLLVGKEDWIVREQVGAQSKEEAENIVIANSHGAFTKSNADELREKLKASDKDFFSSHFNEGATVPGPCLGTGDKTAQTGRWLNNVVREKCFGIVASGDKDDLYNGNAYTADEINRFLAEKYPKSPLRGMGLTIVRVGSAFSVNPALLLGMANAETSLGAGPSVGSHNLFNIGGTAAPRSYAGYEEALESGAKLLSNDSYRQLKDLREIRLKWCGYEDEAESSGIVLSDKTVIDYICANKNSKWEDEVKTTMEQISLMFPRTQADENGALPKVENAPEWCPQTPPEAGPAQGEDYRNAVAEEFQEQLSYFGKSVGGGGYSGEGRYFGSSPIITGNGECALPIPGNTNIVSGYGSRRGDAKHRGLDFSAPGGTPVVSVLDGAVVLSENQSRDNTGYPHNTNDNGGYGNRIIIKHSNGLYSEYHHLSHGSLLPVGTQVKRGQTIALVDHNGWSSGPHLHFQLMAGPSTENDWIDARQCLGLK